MARVPLLPHLTMTAEDIQKNRTIQGRVAELTDTMTQSLSPVFQGTIDAQLTTDEKTSDTTEGIRTAIANLRKEEGGEKDPEVETLVEVLEEALNSTPGERAAAREETIQHMIREITYGIISAFQQIVMVNNSVGAELDPYGVPQDAERQLRLLQQLEGISDRYDIEKPQLLQGINLLAAHIVDQENGRLCNGMQLVRTSTGYKVEAIQE